MMGEQLLSLLDARKRLSASEVNTAIPRITRGLMGVSTARWAQSRCENFCWEKQGH